MKTSVLAIVCLAIGIVAGIYCTRSELQPTDLPPLVRLVRAEGGGQSSDALAGAPRVIVVNGERYDFGVMDRHHKMSHEFIIRNDGEAPLTLVQGATSCKCTTSKLDEGQLPPGQETRVRLEWKANLTDIAEFTFEQSAQFTTNDPARPVLRLVVHGGIIDAIRASPNSFALGEISTSESVEVSTTLYGFRPEPLEVTKVEWSNAALARHFEVSFEPRQPEQLPSDPQPQHALTMKVAIKPGLPVGLIEETIQLWTTAQPDEPLPVLLQGKVVGDVRVAGPGASADQLLVSLPRVFASQGLKHTVYVIVKTSDRNESALRISSLEPPTEFQATLGDPIRDNPRVVRYPLTIEIPPGTVAVSRSSPGSYAKILLDTGRPEGKDVELKLRYVIQD